MVDIKALKQVMATKGWSAEKLADALGIDRSTLFRRFQSNGADFTVEEVNAIVSALGLSREDAHCIFFQAKSHKREFKGKEKTGHEVHRLS